MNMKHTPGPWTHVVSGTNNNIIAADEDTILDDYPYYPCAPMNAADYPLIAAAPDMLEALQFGLLYLDCFGPPTGTTPNAEKEFKRIARAAIAKATGAEANG